MQRSPDNAYECMVAYSRKLPRICVTSLPSSWVLDPVLLQELLCPRGSEATLLLELRCLAPKSCLHPSVDAAST